MLSTFMKVPMLYLLPFPQKLFEDTSIPANPCKYETIYIYDNLGRDIWYTEQVGQLSQINLLVSKSFVRLLCIKYVHIQIASIL